MITYPSRKLNDKLYQSCGHVLFIYKIFQMVIFHDVFVCFCINIYAKRHLQRERTYVSVNV